LDPDFPGRKVQVNQVQRGQLSDPQSGAGGEGHDKPPAFRHGRFNPVQLVERQEATLDLLSPRQLTAWGGSQGGRRLIADVVAFTVVGALTTVR
jgi:hypothetical protein